MMGKADPARIDESGRGKRRVLSVTPDREETWENRD